MVLFYLGGRMMIDLKLRSDGVLLIQFKYDAILVEKVKRLPGRRYHVEEKTWTVPLQVGVWKKVAEVFHGCPIRMDNSIPREVQSLFYSHSVERRRDKEEVWLKRYLEELKSRGYASKTQKAYLGHMSLH